VTDQDDLLRALVDPQVCVGDWRLEKMRRWVLLLFGAGVLLLSAGLIVLAQGGYDLSWWTVDGGGYMYCAGGGYELGGTIGQADAGVLTGGGYTLGSGFWRGGSKIAPWYESYLPLLVCK
jgi:hypothetical protein